MHGIRNRHHLAYEQTVPGLKMKTTVHSYLIRDAASDVYRHFFPFISLSRVSRDMYFASPQGLQNVDETEPYKQFVLSPRSCCPWILYNINLQRFHT